VPTATVIGAYEHALRLAALRGRAAPGRSDLIDAIASCFVKGARDAEGVPLLAATRRLMVGNALGSVPPGAGAPPLVWDFERRARWQRLRIDDTDVRRLSLDIYRRPEHRVTSRLLHGLDLLGVRFAIRQAGPDFVRGIGIDRLHEQWQYQFSPSTEASLVEMSVYGTTVPEAVATRFTQILDRLVNEGASRSASVAVACLVQACQLGLHDHLPRLLSWLRTAIGEDAAFPSLGEAVTQLMLLWQSREPLEAAQLEEIPPLLLAAYERACFLAADMAATPEAAIESTVGALKGLRQLLLNPSATHLDPELFWQAIPNNRPAHRCSLALSLDFCMAPASAKRNRCPRASPAISMAVPVRAMRLRFCVVYSRPHANWRGNTRNSCASWMSA
jgi:hypothetical protein